MTLFVCECSEISAYAHVGGKEMHHICLRAENKEGIFLPYGKAHFIICIIIAQTSSLQIICRGQGALSKDKNSSKINLFCEKNI